ncbi:beta-propeller fold lactonase family protein [Prolixibacteraceae bacterium]|nr:beta-propeller fold lactonase family protein [Prolixibacteraceae bacterium]
MKRYMVRIFICVFVLISSCKSKTEQELLYVGTYTQGTSEGVYSIDLERDTLYSHLVLRVSNPSYVDFYDDHIACVEEDVPNGKIHLGRLMNEIESEEINSEGGAPCYISFSPSSRYVAWANYMGGKVVVCDIENMKRISFEHFGHGPVVGRQDASHMHSVVWSKDEQKIFTVDLGSDIIGMCSLNVPSKVEKVFEFPKGSGPRHMLFTKDYKYAFVVAELSNELYLLKWNRKEERFEQLVVCSTLRGDDVVSYAAAVKLSNNEKYVYVSNRGENNIIRFKFDRNEKTLNDPKWFDVHGDFPRDLALNKTNTVMAVANQKSHNVTLFDIDSEGCLSYQNRDINLDQPVFVKFYTHQ